MSFECRDFQKDVLDASFTKPVLVDFWAEWCAPCRALGPVLESLAAKHSARWALVKVDTEAHQDVALRYDVRSIPNVKLFVDGEPVDEFTGALPVGVIEEWLAKRLPSPYAKILEAASALIKAGDTQTAEQQLSEVLAAEPQNQQALVMKAFCRLNTNPEEAARWVDGIREDSDVYPEAEAIRTFGLLFNCVDGSRPLSDSSVKPIYLAAIKALGRQDYQTALDGFVEVLRIDREYDDGGARKACIAVFKLLGEDQPLVKEKRRDFASALYA